MQQPAVGEQPPAVDYTQHIQQLAKGLADKAEHDVREEFEKQGIRHLDVSSFYEREKDPRTGQETGRVVFRNPDYPNGPRISRTECQQIVDTLNAQIDREMSKAVEERKQQYMEDNRSTFRMYEFAPSYSQMEDSAQKIFNILIKDYAVVRNGKTVGWNCDLKQMAQVARNIASSYAPQTQPQAAPEPSKPVVDNPAGSTGTAPQAEPKDLAEAMKMYQQQQKNNRK